MIKIKDLEQGDVIIHEGRRVVVRWMEKNKAVVSKESAVYPGCGMGGIHSISFFTHKYEDLHDRAEIVGHMDVLDALEK
jgi:hypothetical protein